MLQQRLTWPVERAAGTVRSSPTLGWRPRDRAFGIWVRAIALAGLGLLAVGARAQSCTWSHIDRVVAYDDAGLWNTDVYRGVLSVLTVAQVGGALWEGSQTRFGKTLWQGIDAQILAGLTASVGKRMFTRARPNQGGDPCLWFQGSGYDSFPSRESASAMALIGPLVLEYGAEHPAAYALLALPLWIGTARVKNQAHWQSDVLAGWAIGAGASWIASSLSMPVTVQILPGSVALGLKMQF